MVRQCSGGKKVGKFAANEANGSKMEAIGSKMESNGSKMEANGS